MFGISMTEIIVIAVIAVIVLGPDKLPGAMVQVAKLFKTIRDSIGSAKSTFAQEVKIAELKEDAKKFKDSMDKTASSARKKLTFEELDEIKKTADSSLKGVRDALKNPFDILNNDPLNLTPAERAHLHAKDASDAQKSGEQTDSDQEAPSSVATTKPAFIPTPANPNATGSLPVCADTPQEAKDV